VNQTLVLADGPALRVRVAGKAERRYPLSRLSRVLSAGRVEWRQSAIEVCLERRLPVVFLSQKGEPRGYLWPAVAAPSSLYQVMSEVSKLEAGAYRFGEWVRSQRMALLRRWCARRASEGGDAVGDSEFARLVREHVYARGAAASALAGADVYGPALMGAVIGSLHDAGVAPSYVGHGGTVIDVAAGLQQLMQLVLELEFRGLGARATGDDATLLHLLHAIGPVLKSEIRYLIGALHRCMREMLDTWR
jgi:hypothetical protein